MAAARRSEDARHHPPGLTGSTLTAPAVAAVLAAVLLLLAPGPTRAQGPQEDGSLRVAAFAGGSFREGPSGFRVARDVTSYSVRLSLPRGIGLQPWLEAGGFNRPDLECPEGFTCTTEGWTLLGGVVLPLSLDDTRPGAHPYLLGGIGAAFSDEAELATVMGLGVSVGLTPRLAPAVELRWQQFPEIRNVLMLNLGLRLDLF